MVEQAEFEKKKRNRGHSQSTVQYEFEKNNKNTLQNEYEKIKQKCVA